MSTSSNSLTEADTMAEMKRWNTLKQNIEIHNNTLHEKRRCVNLKLKKTLTSNSVKKSSGDPYKGNFITEAMQTRNKFLENLNISTDYTFCPFKDQMNNTMMQICAWDEGIEGSSVSGYVDIRTAFNVNTRLDSNDNGHDVMMPFTVYALSRKRTETLRNAVQEEPTLRNAIEALIDVFEDRSYVKFTTARKPDTVIPICNAIEAEHSLCVSSDTDQHITVADTRYTAIREASSGVARDLEVRRSVVSFHPDIRTKRFVAECVSVKDNVTKTVACFVMSNYDPNAMRKPVERPMGTANARKIERDARHPHPTLLAHVFGLEEDLVGSSDHNILGWAQLNMSLPINTATVAQGLACMKSIAIQATRCTKDSLMAKAFEVCRSDPYLSTASVDVVSCLPGLRVLHLTLNADNNAIPGRHVCIILTAVKECEDLDMITQAKVFHARSSNRVTEPSKTNSTIQPQQPNKVVPVTTQPNKVVPVTTRVQAPPKAPISENVTEVRNSGEKNVKFSKVVGDRSGITRPKNITPHAETESVVKYTRHTGNDDMFWQLTGTFNATQRMLHESLFPF